MSCPTAASNDAPCSVLSVVYTEDGDFDFYQLVRRNPALVLVDTQVVAQAPPRLLVAGMGDALATWFEARTCVRRLSAFLSDARLDSRSALFDLSLGDVDDLESVVSVDRLVHSPHR